MFWILFAFAKDRTKVEKKDWWRLVLCALTALAVNQMLFMKGISYTYSIHVSLLLLISPILITFFASWMLKERITLLKIFGLLLGITGATILISLGTNNGSGNNVVLGDLLIILSTISYTLYFILVKPLMVKYPAIEVMRWTFTFGLIMVLPLGWNEVTAINWGHYHTLEYALLFIIIVPGTIMAYIFNAYGIKLLGASTAGSYIYLQPVFTVVTAVFFLGEALVLYKIIAAVLIFAGVYLANKKTNI